jgi:hypothetical protein
VRSCAALIVFVEQEHKRFIVVSAVDGVKDPAFLDALSEG